MITNPDELSNLFNYMTNRMNRILQLSNAINDKIRLSGEPVTIDTATKTRLNTAINTMYTEIIKLSLTIQREQGIPTQTAFTTRELDKILDETTV